MNLENHQLACQFLTRANVRWVSPCTGLIAVHPDDLTAAKALWQAAPALQPIAASQLYLHQIVDSRAGLWHWTMNDSPAAPAAALRTRIAQQVRITYEESLVFKTRDMTAPYAVRQAPPNGSLTAMQAETPVMFYDWNNDRWSVAVGEDGVYGGNGPVRTNVRTLKLGQDIISDRIVKFPPHTFSPNVQMMTGGFGPIAGYGLAISDGEDVGTQVAPLPEATISGWPVVFRPGLLEYYELYHDGYELCVGRPARLQTCNERVKQAATDAGLSGSDAANFIAARDRLAKLGKGFNSSTYVFCASIASVQDVLSDAYAHAMELTADTAAITSRLTIGKWVVGAWDNDEAVKVMTSDSANRVVVAIQPGGSVCVSNGEGAMTGTLTEFGVMLRAWLASGQQITVIRPATETETSRAIATALSSLTEFDIYIYGAVTAGGESHAVSASVLANIGLAVVTAAGAQDPAITIESLHTIRAYLHPTGFGMSPATIITGAKP